MPFWSGEKLEKELGNCIEGNYNKNDIDCAAFTLHVGPEVFITPDHYEPHPSKNTKNKLSLNESFNIPSGQFAFLLTEEIIKVPHNCIAFISMKAKTKYKGLINVSGFHVDPGFNGRLTFSVYNAGPASIMLRRGMPLFLLWYAELDNATKYVKAIDPVLELDFNIISPIQGPIFSPHSITQSVNKFKSEIKDEIHAVDLKVTKVTTIAAFILLMLISVGSYIIKASIDNVSAVSKATPVSQNKEQ